MNRFNVYKTEKQTCNALAKWMTHIIQITLEKQDRFTIALAGGNTPKTLYQILASDYKNEIDWSKIHVFWGDERCVPFDDERNNAHMAFENLLNHVSVLPSQIFIIKTNIPPAESAEQYENILH